MADPYRYAAFISYSSKDTKFALRLHRALEGYGIPSALGKFDILGGGKRNRIYPVFRDREELSAGHLGDQIEANLKASAALIVVCSPNGAASPWVQKEIEFFAAHGRHAKIFAIIPDTAPLTDDHGADCTQSCFPPAFRGDALAGDKLEPLAADARKGKDGFRNAWLKIVAGIIGVSPGQLIDRDRRRRTQQALGTAAGWLTVLVGVGAAFLTQDRWRPPLETYWRYERFAHSTETLLNGPTGPESAFQDCQQGSSDCPVMLVIPEGTFLMGERPAQALDERGQQARGVDVRRRISIRRFAVSRTEITFADWQACFDAGACGNEMPDRRGWEGDNRPVINVSWSDAQKYVDWLSRMTGHEYRLLTEAEWEYAARGVTSADDPRNGEEWSFGNDANLLGDHAWFAANSEQRTQPVGTKRPNQFGLHDVYGNVLEWVQDCHADYDPTRLDGSAREMQPDDEGTCFDRVLRGGAYNFEAHRLGSAYRNSIGGGVRNRFIGFRVARTL